MTDSILSVGIDLGTTTTQMIVSRLQIENAAAPFAVPRMEIQTREILYRSDIYFTPLRSPDTLDLPAIRQLIGGEYEKAGIAPGSVQTGAVIITGETARKENARQVLEALAEFAGEFVVATAGPALESVLAARGAGADRAAKSHGRYVLHMDIGGGTTNLALFAPDGSLVDTGCLNIGGRLMKFDRDGTVTYISPVLSGMDTQDPQRLCEALVQVLEQAAGLRPVEKELSHFITDKTVTLPDQPVLLSFSGGVSDLIAAEEQDVLRYGDLGVYLGRAIGNSRLCQGEYLLGRETIRATVVGAGSHATELSGSTIFYVDTPFPLQNLPVEEVRELTKEEIQTKLALRPGEPTALFWQGLSSPSFAQVMEAADAIAEAVPPGEGVVVAMEQDMAKTLGQALRLRLGSGVPVMCLDGLHPPTGSYLDIAAPVAGGTAVPVIIKTLAFE